MDDEELIHEVRRLRAKGHSPKEIARALGVRPALVAPLVRRIGAEESGAPAESSVVRCWVSRGWSDGLTVDGHPEWPDAGHDIVDVDRGCSGLVGVLIAREHRRSRLSVCGYLVDAYCLGVKDALGPDVMDGRELAVFARHYFSAFGVPPLDAPIELARHLVHGAVEYARGLGFEPAPDFDAARGHLGPWQGPSAIGFGRDGKPMFVAGPYDDSSAVMRTLERSIGQNGFDFVVPADAPGLRAA